jgi:hypothetical protein
MDSHFLFKISNFRILFNGKTQTTVSGRSKRYYSENLSIARQDLVSKSSP